MVAISVVNPTATIPITIVSPAWTPAILVSAARRMQVTSPSNLVNAAGDTIPFSQISWAVSTLGNDTTPNAIPAGTFAGGVQTLTTVPANRLIENCHTFAYANAQVRPAGTYNGTVTYTVSTP